MQNTELILDRIRLQKTNTTLKIAIIIVVLIIGGIIFAEQSDIFRGSKEDYIGILQIDNIIMDDAKFDKLLDDIEKSQSIKAIVLSINSPGGSSGASEKIYHRLKKMSSKTPIVSSMGTVAASGGYLVSLAGQRIFAMNMTITGSIGVLFQVTELVEAAEKLGIKFRSYKSSPLKAAPNPMEAPTPEVEKAAMDIINDSCEYFVSLVAENRKMTIDEAKKVSDGRIYTGRLALNNKLVDEIGTTEDAINWLKKEYTLDENIKVKLLKPKRLSALSEAILDNIDEEVRSFYTKFLQMISIPAFVSLQ
ncbi:MAG: signal peptide peptidase SppA [Rickettsiaceae bacterium]|nr:signal peptide peptidase SppA [Rickettsiaceae bacterium]